MKFNYALATLLGFSAGLTLESELEASTQQTNICKTKSMGEEFGTSFSDESAILDISNWEELALTKMKVCYVGDDRVGIQVMLGDTWLPGLGVHEPDEIDHNTCEEYDVTNGFGMLKIEYTHPKVNFTLRDLNKKKFGTRKQPRKPRNKTV